ncbi:Uncharacterized protein CTYZ_00000582 [Cryptosporidium tyzzeri]|nr:Uncharacterized protein CTYZ_00000582 [Cryptosporidium tyzzeri]
MLLNKSSSSKPFYFTFLVLFYLRVYLYLYEEKIAVRTYTISLVKLQALPNANGINRGGTASDPEQKHNEGDQTKTEDTVGTPKPFGPAKPRCPGAPGFMILSVVDIGNPNDKPGKCNNGPRLRNRRGKRPTNGSGTSYRLEIHTDSGNDGDCESTE